MFVIRQDNELLIVTYHEITDYPQLSDNKFCYTANVFCKQTEDCNYVF